MQCPICHQEMERYHDDLVTSKKKGIAYKRSRYLCRQDDVWGHVEIPQPQEAEATTHEQRVFQPKD